MICEKCEKELKAPTLDNLCGRCRSRKRYIENIDSYRKTKLCVCGKIILKTSNLCSSCSQKKEKNHRWKEEKQDRRITSTVEYRLWNRLVKERDQFKCKICKSGKRIAAHHILPKRDFPEKIFEVSNGITLCHKHHSEIQFKEYKYIDEFKSLIIAEIKLCELGEGCNANTEPSQITLEGVTTRDEINFPTSAGQPL